METNLGKKVVRYAEEISKFSEPGEGVTRLFLTEEHRQALDMIKGWMEEAGMETRLDAMGNLIGERRHSANAPTLMLGSHQDSVREGGKHDGMLGVIVPLVCLQEIRRQGVELPYNVEVAAFGDEEGVRFDQGFMCSRARAGNFDDSLLEKKDADGITLKEALKNFGLDPSKVGDIKAEPAPDAYIEVHIEQGPVLIEKKLPVGFVTSIACTKRALIAIEGKAGHAGTVPMNMRQDAGVGLAEFVCAVEAIATNNPGAVGTVGKANFLPGAMNVIPGKAEATLDLRAPDDETVAKAWKEISEVLDRICRNRNLAYRVDETFFSPARQCDEDVVDVIRKSIDRCGIEPFGLPSGAGHDAQEMKAATKMGMLFVRCYEGISHHPLENISIEDADHAAKVVMEVLLSHEVTDLLSRKNGVKNEKSLC